MKHAYLFGDFHCDDTLSEGEHAMIGVSVFFTLFDKCYGMGVVL